MQRGKFITALFTFVLASATSFGATISVPGDYGTIQEAIDGAIALDTIIVGAGTYVENIDFAGKAITVRSAEGAELTIIDGSLAGATATFANGEGSDSILDGFTITNGRSADGGGIYCHYASPTIVNNKVWGNEADSGKGGGLFIKHSSASITDNEFYSNSAIYGGGGICSNRSTATFRGNRIYENYSGNSSGGGFYGYYSNDVIEDNLFYDNEAGYSGGGVYVTLSDSSINGNRIERNIAPFGGGLACNDSEPTISENSITDNTADTGGGIDCYNSSPVIDNNIISNNSAGGSGGIYSGGGSSPTITRNIVSSNSAASSGGGINCGTDTVIAGNMIYKNSAGNIGGGIYCHSGNPSIVGNTITQNSSAVSGGGIGCWNSAASVANTIVWNNAAGDGAEIYVGNATYPSTFEIGYSDVKGGQGSVTVESSCAINWGPGMIDATPGFAQPAADDFHLLYSSLCIDSGDSAAQNLLATDFEGDPRIYLDAADMGADEFHFHLYCVGDVVPGDSVAIKVVGGPNMPVIVALGSGVQSPPLQTAYGELHLSLPLLKSYRSRIPATGILVLDAPVPLTWASGDTHPAQALVGGKHWLNTTLTNLMLLTVD